MMEIGWARSSSFGQAPLRCRSTSHVPERGATLPRKPLKLLVSAYACAPNRGSDHGIGWNWTTEAHRLGHEIWALVSPAHREAIEKACDGDAGLRGIRWIFPEVTGWPLKQAIEPKWERTYNLLWQIAALQEARRLHRQVAFDAVHHSTWSGIRAPTFLGALGCPLIIGPIGGGETSPASLRDGLGRRGRLLEAVRDLSSATITLNPIVRPGLASAAAIFACTADTKDLLGRAFGDKTMVFTPLGISSVTDSAPRRSPDGPTRFLVAGRLLYWKGIHIALRAFAEVARRIPEARFTIVGDGPERGRLEAEARRHGVQDKVTCIPRLPQQQLFELYDAHDLFLFPSLHDAGGFVVLEALSRGMPVMCLDLGGPGDMVTPDCGVVIGTKGRNTEQVAMAMAEEILRLRQTPSELARLSAGALGRARQFLLPDRIGAFYDRVTQIVAARA